MSGGNPEALGSRVPLQAAAGVPLPPGVNIGDVLYWDGAAWTILLPGADGFQLTTHAIGLAPTWEPGTVPVVTSVFGRVGAVVAAAGDYTSTQIANLSGVAGATVTDALNALNASAAVLGFGANNLTATTTTRYLFPWFSDNQAETTPTQYRLPRAGTLRNFRVRHNLPAGNGGAIVYTVRIEGVATALTISMASTDSDGSDLVNTVAVAAGARIDIEVTKAAGIGASPINIEASLGFAA